MQQQRCSFRAVRGDGGGGRQGADEWGDTHIFLTEAPKHGRCAPLVGLCVCDEVSVHKTGAHRSQYA